MTPSSKQTRGVQPGRSPVSIADLIEAGLLRPHDRLTFYNKNAVIATVTSAGTLIVNGREYKSPSTAATAVAGTSRNGWTAWIVNVGGASVSLSDLRSDLLARK